MAFHNSSTGSQPTDSRTKPGATASPQRARRSADVCTPAERGCRLDQRASVDEPLRRFLRGQRQPDQEAEALHLSARQIVRGVGAQAGKADRLDRAVTGQAHGDDLG